MGPGQPLFSFTLLPGGSQASLAVFNTSWTDASANLFRVSAMILSEKKKKRLWLLLQCGSVTAALNVLTIEYHQYSPRDQKYVRGNWVACDWITGLSTHEPDHSANTQEWRGCRENLAQILCTTDVTSKADIIKRT